MRRLFALALTVILTGICGTAHGAATSAWRSAIPVSPKHHSAADVERIVASIEDGLLHVRRQGPGGDLVWSVILGEAVPDHPPTVQRLGASVEVRHANGHYFVRDTFWGSVPVRALDGRLSHVGIGFRWVDGKKDHSGAIRDSCSSLG
jgi:hypothetical protein